MHLCFCPFHPSYWRWKVQTVDPVSMGAKQFDALFLATGFEPPIRQTTSDSRTQQQEHIHVDLEYPQRPASYHLAPIAMHLCFCPFHPSYWRWKVQTVDPVNMGAKQFDDLFLQIFHHQLERSLLFQLLWIQTKDSGGDGILALVCNSCNKTSPGTKYLKQKRLQGLQHLTTQCLRIFVSRGPHGHRTSWKCLQTSTRLRPTTGNQKSATG